MLWDFKYLRDNNEKKVIKATEVSSAGFLFPGNTPVLIFGKCIRFFFLSVGSSYSFPLFPTAKGITWKQLTSPLFFPHPTILFNAQVHCPCTGWFWAHRLSFSLVLTAERQIWCQWLRAALLVPRSVRCSAGKALPSSSPACWALPPSAVPLLSIPCNSLSVLLPCYQSFWIISKLTYFRFSPVSLNFHSNLAKGFAGKIDLLSYRSILWISKDIN